MLLYRDLRAGNDLAVQGEGERERRGSWIRGFREERRSRGCSFRTRGTPTRARERNESIIGRQRVLTFMVKGQLTVDPRNTLDTATKIMTSRDEYRSCGTRHGDRSTVYACHTD